MKRGALSKMWVKAIGVGAFALTASVQAWAQDPVKVGIALDLSGPFSVLGAESRDGFDLAIEMLDGELGGLPVEFLQNDFAEIGRASCRERVWTSEGVVAVGMEEEW